MQTRPLTRLSVTPGAIGALAVADALGDALADVGPALAPIPVGPAQYVDRIVGAIQPDDPHAPLESDDVAVVLATSGSLGDPRGVLLSSAALLAAARATSDYLGAPARWVLALPVHHIGGLQVLVRSHLAGLPPIPLDSIGGGGPFTASEFANASRAARAIADVDGSALRTALVPTQLARILDFGPAGVVALQCYDTVLVGGAALPAQLSQHCDGLGIAVTTTYGMTEMCGGCVYDGQPLRDIAVRICDVDERGHGRIELAGAQLANGYRLRPELTAQHFRDGRFLTSDRGYLVDACLVVIGRVDDIVQVGGESASLSAVEDAVRSHRLVAEAAVVAVECDELGARLVAFVVPIDGGGLDAQPDARLLASAVTSLVADTLGAASRPRVVRIVAELPQLPTGKVDRLALRNMAGGFEVTDPQSSPALSRRASFDAATDSATRTAG